MDNSSYTTLTRQAGLMREMQAVANNIANLSTTGYRGEGVIFSEYVRPTGPGRDSLSMATAQVRQTDLAQGPLTRTGGAFDMAIDGPGFFLVETPQGQRLTRAGGFTPNEVGKLVTPDGDRLLDAGGAPVFVPPDAPDLSVASDGTLSANGRALTQIGLFQPADPSDLTRQSGTLFEAKNGTIPADQGRILQGFVEDSNVDAISQVARMIEVRNAYQLGQGFLEREDERIRAVVRTLGS